MPHKISSIRKTLFILLFSVSLVFAPIQAQRSDAWLTMAGVAAKSVLDFLRTQLVGIILGAMKQAAVKMLNEAVNNLVSGNSPEESKIISNYQDFLFSEPQEKTMLFINDYISQTTGGQSSGNYESFEGVGSIASGGTSYLTSLAKSAKDSIAAQDAMIKPTYIGNPGENLFSEGNLDNFNSYLSGTNNPWAYDRYIQQKYQANLEKEQQAALVKAIAGQGYKGTEEGGYTITPGALIAAQMANSQDLGNKTISGANSIAEVVSSIAMQAISQTIQNGIGKAQENIQQEINSKTTGTTTSTGGPGEQYGNGVDSSQAIPWENPDTQ